MKHRYILHNNFNEAIDRYHKGLVREIAQRFSLHDTLHQNIFAHFTLKYWFEADENQIAQLDDILASFARSHHSSSALLSGPGGFSPDIIFLGVHLSSEATKVFESLIAELRRIDWITWDMYDAPNLHFHSTIAESCGQMYGSVLQYLQQKKLSDKAVLFNNVTLMQQVGLIEGFPLLKTVKEYAFKAKF